MLKMKILAIACSLYVPLSVGAMTNKALTGQWRQLKKIALDKKNYYGDTYNYRVAADEYSILAPIDVYGLFDVNFNKAEHWTREVLASNSLQDPEQFFEEYIQQLMNSLALHADPLTVTGDQVVLFVEHYAFVMGVTQELFIYKQNNIYPYRLWAFEKMLALTKIITVC